MAIKFFIKSNKKILFIFIIILILILFFGYKQLSKNKENNLFLVQRVERGNLNKIVSGSGNVVAADSFNIISKKGGEIIFLPFKEGDFIRRGDLILELDSRDFQRQIRDTKLNLEKQLNNLEKLKLNKVNLENDLRKVENEYQNFKRADDIKKNYKNSLNLLNNFFSEIPSVILRIEDVYFKSELTGKINEENIKYYLSYFDKNYSEKSDKLKKEIENLKNRFLKLSDNFAKLNTNKDEVNFSFIREVYDFINQIQIIVKIGLDPIRKIKEDTSFKNSTHVYVEIIDNHLNFLSNSYNILNNYSQSLIALINQINIYEDKLKNISLDIENIKFNIEKTETDIKNAEINIQEIKNKLIDFDNDLNDYKIFSPLNGIINSLKFKKGEILSPGVIVMNIISNDKIAEIKLNEIDIADVKIGQKVILTFDALSDLEISGQVIEINPIGDVSQGVVSYLVKIAFQENNKNVKIGMTVNADIIVESKNNILIIPSQAIKKDKDKKYVKVPNEKDLFVLNQKYSILKDNSKNWRQEPVEKEINTTLKYPLQIKFVKTGLSFETNIEVLEGLKEGDWVIIKSQKDEENFSNNRQQGFFQRFSPQPGRFIRSPAIK